MQGTILMELVPFESASELQRAHVSLLESLDTQLGHDATGENEAAVVAQLETQIRQFLIRGAATGIYIEEIKNRTSCQVLLDYWVSSLSQAGRAVSGMRLAQFDGSKLPDLKDKTCPYVGLDAFRTHEFFFGREADTKDLLDQIKNNPLVVVLGASGSGKSSLVMGGVLPALEMSGTAAELKIVPPFVPGNAVLEGLAKAVFPVDVGGGDPIAVAVAQLRQNSRYLSQMIGGTDAPPTLITIDQFEEIFTLATHEDRAALAENLAQILQADRGHRAILTVREEFRNRIVELEALSPYLDKAWYSMRPMSYEELKAAVERPAALVNLQFQTGIVDDLVKKVLGQAAALPLLQFTLRSLWDMRDRNRITWEVYRRVGDPLNALQVSADHFYNHLTQEIKDEVKRVLLELVRVDDLLEAYRQPVPQSRLMQAGKANTERVLKLLDNNDYLRITPCMSGTDAVVEVKHESLVRNWTRFVDWIDEKRRQRRQRLALTHAAQQWAEAGRPTEGLLTGWQLEEAKRQSILSEVEQEFVDASAAEIERYQRQREIALQQEAEAARELAFRERQRLIIAIVGGIFVCLLFSISVIQLKLANETNNQAEAKNMRLEEEKAQLNTKHQRLEAEYNQLWAKGVKQLFAAPQSQLPSLQPVTIYLHISDESQRVRAEDIRKELVKSGIGVASGIERVDTSPKATQVRYFHPDDRLGAQEIKRMLGEYLGVRDIETPLIKGYEKKVPAQRYEIWFDPNAFGDPAY
ncbi:MAG: hypothetical protein U0223_02725 [Nitrospira sp.]|nr:hypothetical protein [Nitrospira sp.]